MRNLRGTRNRDLWKWPVTRLEDCDSTFSIQQFLQQNLIYSKSSEDKSEIFIECPDGQDELVWQYEHLRLFCLQLNQLVCQLLQNEECTQERCTEMKAGEWLYLCATHAQPQNCSAIDYALHTLDGATALLNNSKYFKSRLSMPPQSSKHFQSIARRLYRIFAHAWYQHRSTFDQFEAVTRLYQRFVAYSRRYQLIPDKLMIIPGYGLPDSAGSTGAGETVGSDITAAD